MSTAMQPPMSDAEVASMMLRLYEEGQLYLEPDLVPRLQRTAGMLDDKATIALGLGALCHLLQENSLVIPQDYPVTEQGLREVLNSLVASSPPSQGQPMTSGSSTSAAPARAPAKRGRPRKATSSRAAQRPSSTANANRRSTRLNEASLRMSDSQQDTTENLPPLPQGYYAKWKLGQPN